MRNHLVSVFLVHVLLVPVATASAQGEAYAAAFLPTEFSVGLGGVIQSNPGNGSPDFNFGLSKAYVRDQWIDPALEVGLGPWSNVPPCRDENLPVADAENCVDVYVLFGPRFRPIPASDRRWRPFVQFLLGGYWSGTGQRGDDTVLDSNLALQAGGGVDLRRPTSNHGLRLSADYRRIFAEEQGRHQLQFVVSYFLGWRGPEPESGNPSRQGDVRSTGGIP